MIIGDALRRIGRREVSDPVVERSDAPWRYRRKLTLHVRRVGEDERHLEPEELAAAKEVFLTGTAVEITPVREIDEHRFEVGGITRQLIADFDAMTREPAQRQAV